MFQGCCVWCECLLFCEWWDYLFPDGVYGVRGFFSSCLEDFSFFTVCFIPTSIIEWPFFIESDDLWFRSIMFFHSSVSGCDEMMVYFPDRLLLIGSGICLIIFLCFGSGSDFKVWLFWFCDLLLIKIRDEMEGAADGTIPKFYF